MEHRTQQHGGFEGNLQELDEAACRALLAETSVGRLVWRGQEGLTVVTVNFALEGEDVLVRLAPWSLAARECDRAHVAFQADRADPELREGWSVLARGRGQVEQLPPVSRGAGVDVWPRGSRPVSLRIEVDRLTGRRLGSGL